jgi:hypothetical protein
MYNFTDDDQETKKLLPEAKKRPNLISSRGFQPRCHNPDPPDITMAVHLALYCGAPASRWPLDGDPLAIWPSTSCPGSCWLPAAGGLLVVALFATALSSPVSTSSSPSTWSALQTRVFFGGFWVAFYFTTTKKNAQKNGFHSYDGTYSDLRRFRVDGTPDVGQTLLVCKSGIPHDH